MKKWNEYTGREKRMITVVVVLLVVVLLSWGRVHDDFRKGVSIFYGTPQDTVKTAP